MRRQSKVSESVEYYTTLRSQRAAERADVALVVCDARDGVTAQDLRVADLAMRSDCATLVVAEQVGRGGADGRPRARARARRREAPTAAAGADRVGDDGRNVTRLLSESITLGDRRAARIPTPELNRFLGETVQARQPPAKQGHRLKLLYMAQIGHGRRASRSR